MNRSFPILLLLLFLTHAFLIAQDENALDIPSFLITAQDREVLSVPYGRELLVSSYENSLIDFISLAPYESSKALEVAIEGVEFPPADLDNQESGLFRVLGNWQSRGLLENELQLNVLPLGMEPGLTMMVKYLSLMDTLLEKSQIHQMDFGLSGGFSLSFLSLSFIQQNYLEYSDSSFVIIPRLQAGTGLCVNRLTQSTQLFSEFQDQLSWYFYHQSRLNLDLDFLVLELEQSDMLGPAASVINSHLSSASVVMGSMPDSWLFKAGASFDYSDTVAFYPRLELGLFLNPYLSMELSGHYSKEYPALLSDDGGKRSLPLRVSDLARLFYTFTLHFHKSKSFESQLDFSYMEGDSLKTHGGEMESTQGKWLWTQASVSVWPREALELKIRLDGDYDLLSLVMGASVETAFYVNWPDFLVFGPGGGYAVQSHVYSPYWIFDYCDSSNPVYVFFDIKLPWEKHIDFESRLGIYINESESAFFGQVRLGVSF
ncbi:MAG: hypothetical protein JXR70_16900 [Spirochaetales bacterium]|nr:hypothetical protein [Spirochaetales bacterium]